MRTNKYAVPNKDGTGKKIEDDNLIKLALVFGTRLLAGKSKFYFILVFV